MSVEDAALLTLVVVLAAYLVYALFRPEEFS